LLHRHGSRAAQNTASASVSEEIAGSNRQLMTAREMISLRGDAPFVFRTGVDVEWFTYIVEMILKYKF
jgi:hypothetical protein